MVRVGRYLIYGIIDPRDDCLFYVGKTHRRREKRLAEHVENALQGRRTPFLDRIRGILACGLDPVIFVLERVPSTANWQQAERQAIALWREWPAASLPYLHPPQTPKSVPVIIRRVDLLNVRDGG
jgi:hypothetical protein